MSKKKGGFKEMFYEKIAPVITGLGAAVVILGALFKLQYWPGASTMLTVGLGTEAILFVLFAFAPAHKDPDWSKVYPELAEGFDDEPIQRGSKGKAVASTGVSAQMDKMLADAKVGPELVESLGKGLRNLADSTKQMANLSNAAVATNDYAKNVQNASKALTDMNKSYASTVEAMSAMASASKDAKEYHTQIQSATKNLSQLNAVYEMELKDANSHLKTMNKFYSNVSVAMENVAEAGKGTEQFKQEMSKLTGNLNNLNKVYGNMLTAMKG
ncbi:MAG: gliding motility protein GldL [Cyclobacteriaceae bacterium]|nr:gliding motility protein GldL [Cyclobacteriaceae bacterium]MCH8515042.1 gliding motility protein GldL [Cyclobacteriaceae bacterium]